MTRPSFCFFRSALRLIFALHLSNLIMAEKSEARVLADCYQDVRKLTKFYLSKAATIDEHERIVANGVRLNSLYWLTGHLAWAENALLLKAIGGEPLDIPWLDRFELGADFEYDSSLPPHDELVKTMDTIHDRAMRTILSMTPEQLEEPQLDTGLFGPEAQKRTIIRHAIRHEPCHAGQIGWLCKMHGIETI